MVLLFGGVGRCRILPHASGGGGPRSCAVEGARAATQRKHHVPHPEARAERASKDEAPASRPASFEGRLRRPPQDEGTQAKLPRSRDASASELSLHAVRKPFPKPHSKKWREAKRRKAPLHRPRRRRQVYAVCANHLPCGARHAETDVTIRPRFGRARLSALHRGSRQRPESHRLSSRPCFLGRGSKRALPAFHLSQSRDCTSRAGRSTGVNDARSRPGAGRILRPVGLGSLALLYLLASPLGQMQFRRAESGASGQTTVTEDDVRRFIFPRAILKSVDKVAAKIEASRKEIMKRRRELDVEETSLWRQLEQFSI
jgi:hypothetical protein